MFTVKQLSKLAGVTPRTLHHYDAIGLLKPSRIGDNGYRYYGEEALLRLQQILFYRELDLPLEDIRGILGRHDFDVMGALYSHKQALQERVSRLNRLIQTVDKTLFYLKGKQTMNEKILFEGFSDEEQEQYAREAEKMYGAESVRASMKKWKAYPEAEKKRILAEAGAIYRELITSMPEGAASQEVQAAIGRWRRNIEYFWTPNDEQLLGLAAGYNDDPRFKATFDKMHPQLAGFMLEAVKVYVKNRRK
jgi:DNA-binding transcriptional MerR regulator